MQDYFWLVTCIPCHHCVDTGSTVSSAAKIDKELLTTLGKASAAYGKLHQRLRNNRHASIRVKSRVYRAGLLSNPLYKAESWIIHRTQVKKLVLFVNRQLTVMRTLKWYDKITNEETHRRSNMPCVVDILNERNPRWLGHVHRVDNDRRLRKLLYSNAKSRVKKLGRHILRFKDVAK